MDILFNDFSIDEQFKDEEEFIESLIENTLPSIDLMVKFSDVLLLKSSEIFSKNIIKDMSFGMVMSQKAFIYPEITKFKNLLVDFIAEPYWKCNPSTDVDAYYKCDIIGEFDGKNANCFSEAFERNAPILSLMHNKYSEQIINVSKGDEKRYINNIFNIVSASEYLFSINLIGFSQYILSWKYQLDVQFLKNGDSYYADDCFKNNSISKNDVKEIFTTFKRFISNLDDKIYSKLTKSISHKGITYYEFRTKLSDEREFRIYYYRDGNKLIFLNSYLKKEQKIPDKVKNYSIELIKKWQNNN